MGTNKEKPVAKLKAGKNGELSGGDWVFYTPNKNYAHPWFLWVKRNQIMRSNFTQHSESIRK